MGLYNIIGALFRSGPVYIRIRRDWVSVRDIPSGKQWEAEPLIGIEPKSHTIHAVGSQARTPGLNVINPFEHPRLMIHDFLVAERLLQYGLVSILGSRFSRGAPIVIVHITETLAGGLTSIEQRAFFELGYALGARKVYLWEGNELADHEIREKKYLSVPNEALERPR